MKRIIILAVMTMLVAMVAPAQDWAKARLDKSPRHGEWVKIKQGSREVQSFITYPEVKDKATAVLVIHEIFGLSDWARSVTDELAEAGYIAIAPDLLSGAGPKGGGTSELSQTSGVGQAIQALPADQITADLKACVEYLKSLPSCNGKVVVIGFCWGGGQSFRFATDDKDVKAALVCYGPGPKPEDITRINSPVYGFYGGKDGRITLSTQKTADQMKAAGKTYELNVYDGAGHGFMRAGEDPGDTNADNKKAHDAAWVRIKDILNKI